MPCTVPGPASSRDPHAKLTKLSPTRKGHPWQSRPHAAKMVVQSKRERTENTMRQPSPKARRFWEMNERRLTSEINTVELVVLLVCHFGLELTMLALLVLFSR